LMAHFAQKTIDYYPQGTWRLKSWHELRIGSTWKFHPSDIRRASLWRCWS